MNKIGNRKISEWVGECKRRNGDCYIGTRCEFTYICSQQAITPHKLVADPPRFTEAQMALLKALWAVGVLEVDDDREYDQVIIYTARGRIGGFKNEGGIELPLNADETLDLAELFGKEEKSE